MPQPSWLSRGVHNPPARQRSLNRARRRCRPAAERVSVALFFGGLRRRHISDSAAYVIYTSGSTGTPKGVVVSSSGLWPPTSRGRRLRYAGNGRARSPSSPRPMAFDATVTSVSRSRWYPDRLFWLLPEQSSDGVSSRRLLRPAASRWLFSSSLRGLLKGIRGALGNAACEPGHEPVRRRRRIAGRCRWCRGGSRDARIADRLTKYGSDRSDGRLVCIHEIASAAGSTRDVPDRKADRVRRSMCWMGGWGRCR